MKLVITAVALVATITFTQAAAQEPPKPQLPPKYVELMGRLPPEAKPFVPEAYAMCDAAAERFLTITVGVSGTVLVPGPGDTDREVTRQEGKAVLIDLCFSEAIRALTSDSPPRPPSPVVPT